WELILFNFITKLLLFKELITKVKYNSIFIRINRFMKIAYFILFKEASNTKKLAYIIIRFIISNYRLPREIISN
ncbi:hypothetical protein TRIATDRAFT_194006, partial [Trichoderma atroviride IMI 206040]